jgi:hypothetical protein
MNRAWIGLAAALIAVPLQIADADAVPPPLGPVDAPIITHQAREWHSHRHYAYHHRSPVQPVVTAPKPDDWPCHTAIGGDIFGYNGRFAAAFHFVRHGSYAPPNNPDCGPSTIPQ